jgi:hypothetical protein
MVLGTRYELGGTGYYTRIDFVLVVVLVLVLEK